MKDNLAGKIRVYMAEHPSAKASKIAEATGATLAYVYSVAQKARKAKIKAKAKHQATKGQIVVRSVLNKDADLVENMKTLLMVQQNRIEQLTTIVAYLETVCFKDGASV